MIERAGASLLSVHGRHREQKGPVTGLASWSHIKAVKDAVRIPVFANGNIQSRDDVIRCLNETGADGVMSAEGILHNPAIFTGFPVTVWQVTREYLELVQQYSPPFSYVRGHVFKFLHHCLALKRHQALRHIVAKTHLVEALVEVANKLEEHYRHDYEQYISKHPEMFQHNHHHNSSSPNSYRFIHPDSLPIFFCKPYYRPPPTEFNSKIGNVNSISKQCKNNSDNNVARDQNVVMKKQSHPHLPFISKRHLKKMEKCSLNKKLKIGQIEENCVPIKIAIKRQLPLCAQCPNPKGSRCEFDFCKKCCRIKTQEELLNCKGMF